MFVVGRIGEVGTLVILSNFEKKLVCSYGAFIAPHVVFVIIDPGRETAVKFIVEYVFPFVG